jgi:hypothetical protein
MQPKLFGDDTEKVWQWFLPNILPTLTMVGVAAYAGRQRVGRLPLTVFIFAIATSLLYLFVLTATMIVGSLFEAQPLEFMRRSSLWLAPLQAFASSSLAYYFVKK